MSVASWDSDPLFGTASLSRAPEGLVGTGSSSEVGVDVVEGEAAAEHHHLRVVQQLADLLGCPLWPLVLGSHPGLGGLLDKLLADRVHARVQLGDRAGAGRTGPGLVVELVPELLERLHRVL